MKEYTAGKFEKEIKVGLEKNVEAKIPSETVEWFRKRLVSVIDKLKFKGLSVEEGENKSSLSGKYVALLYGTAIELKFYIDGDDIELNGKLEELFWSKFGKRIEAPLISGIKKLGKVIKYKIESDYNDKMLVYEIFVK